MYKTFITGSAVLIVSNYVVTKFKMVERAAAVLVADLHHCGDVVELVY